MERKYLAFDIETAKLLPEGVTELLAHRPLGIACAAAFASDKQEAITWHGRLADGSPAPQLSRDEAHGLVNDLVELVRDGYTLVTWNGLSFDFNVLAEEADAREECAELAMNHIDMMFHVVCDRGHYLGLQKAALGMNLPGKLSDVSGAEAPKMWSEGKHDEILAYCTQDVRVTANLAATCDAERKLCWTTQRGKVTSMPLPKGWLPVTEARDLPEPDTSWMSKPPVRADFFSWMSGE